MAEGFFRSKKGFTVVQNEITRDVNISLKAKGLYLVIQAYISMPDKKWTKEDFRNLTKEGKKAFDSAWKELKDFGYLKVHFMPDNGKWQAEYELLDEPDLGPHTLYHNSNGEISSNNLTRAERKQQADLCAEENEQASSAHKSACCFLLKITVIRLQKKRQMTVTPLLVLTVKMTVTPFSVATVTVTTQTVITLTVATQMGVTIIKTII